MEHRKQAQTANMVERRTFNIEHRASADGAKKIGGMAAVYDSPTNMGWYVEVIKPGFFDGIRTGAAACLKNHDPNLVLGRTNNNTLKLTFTPSGLDYEAILPKTTIGNDTYEEVSSGYIYQSSFAFTVAEQNWRQAQPSEFAGVLDQDTIEKLTYGGVVDVRELIKGADLYDVSPVTYPAYDATSVTSREASPLFEVRNKFLGISEDKNLNAVSTGFVIRGEDLALTLNSTTANMGTQLGNTITASSTGDTFITNGTGWDAALRSTAPFDFPSNNDEERTKIKVEVEVEINEPEKPEMPDGEMPDEAPIETDAALYARQIQINLNRLRVAQAKRAQFV